MDERQRKALLDSFARAGVGTGRPSLATKVTVWLRGWVAPGPAWRAS